MFALGEPLVKPVSHAVILNASSLFGNFLGYHSHHCWLVKPC